MRPATRERNKQNEGGTEQQRMRKETDEPSSSVSPAIHGSGFTPDRKKIDERMSARMRRKEGELLETDEPQYCGMCWFRS